MDTKRQDSCTAAAEEQLSLGNTQNAARHAVTVQSDGEFERQQDDVNSCTEEVYRGRTTTMTPRSASLSLQHYSDYVLVVPTPRTSSPIPDRSPTRSDRELELDRGSRNAGGQRTGGQKNRTSHIHKTVGRLKRYFGLAAACGNGSQSLVGSRGKQVDYVSTAVVDGRQQEHRIANGGHIDAADDAYSHRTERRGEFKTRLRHENEKLHVNRKQVGGSMRSVDDLALDTVVPGIRVRVPPRRQMSHHRNDSGHVMSATQTGSWVDREHARSRANVERWLCQSGAETGRIQQHPGRSARHAQNDFRSDGRASDEPTSLQRTRSETEMNRMSATDRDQQLMTSFPVATPASGAGSESRLGPSLMQLVAEIIEGLEQRSRDYSQRSRDEDSTAVPHASATPASRVFCHHQQLMKTDSASHNCQSADEDAGNENINNGNVYLPLNSRQHSRQTGVKRNRYFENAFIHQSTYLLTKRTKQSNNTNASVTF